MKNRYRRTFVEKYGITSIISKEDCREMINKLILDYRKVNTNLSEDEWIFNKLPYIGILYYSAGSGLWYDTNLWRDSKEDKPLIRNKVIAVDEIKCTIVSIDDHSGGIAIMNYKEHKDLLIEGNVCKHITEFEEVLNEKLYKFYRYYNRNFNTISLVIANN